MFDTLIASKPGRSSSLNSRTVLVSVAAHVLLLGGTVYAVANAPEPKAAETEEVVAYVDIQETPAPEPVEPPPPPEIEESVQEEPAVVEAPEQESLQMETPEPEPAPSEPVAQGFQDLAPPETVSDRIPDVDPSARAVSPEDFSGVGAAGGVSTGVAGGTSRNTAEEPPSGSKKVSDSPVDVEVVEVRPKLLNASEMQRVMKRLYPSLLRDAGVSGQTVLRFVIDAQGRVEPSSISVVSSSHESFATASTEAAQKFRFRPAKIGDRNVRVSISMPISWTLENA